MQMTTLLQLSLSESPKLICNFSIVDDKEAFLIIDAHCFLLFKI